MNKAGEVLKHYLHDKQIEKASRYHSLFRSWNDICGPQFKGHSRIKELENENLIVEVDHPGWIQLLQLQEKRILKKLNRAFPELVINRISLKLGKFNNEIILAKKDLKKDELNEESENQIFNLVEEFQKRILQQEKSSKS